MAKKYYKVPRFLKLQYVDEKDKRIESDWVEVNADGSSIEKKEVKKEVKTDKK